MKKYVAIEYSSDGTCEKVLEVKTICESEYKKLKGQEIKHGQEKKKDKEELIKKFAKLDLTDSKLALAIAYSIYSDMVDRGIIECDQDFISSFDDYLLGKVDKLIVDYPKEMQLILEKIRG